MEDYLKKRKGIGGGRKEVDVTEEGLLSWFISSVPGKLMTVCFQLFLFGVAVGARGPHPCQPAYAQSLPFCVRRAGHLTASAGIYPNPSLLKKH